MRMTISDRFINQRKVNGTLKQRTLKYTYRVAKWHFYDKLRSFNVNLPKKIIKNNTISVP